MANLSLFIPDSRSAQGRWASLPVKKRAEYLLTLRETLLDHIQDVLKVLSPGTPSQSFPILSEEILGSIEQITHAARIGRGFLKPDWIRHNNPLLIRQKTRLQFRPLGTVLLLGYGGTPLLSTFSRLAPALITGNSILIQPSESNSQIVSLVIELCEKAGLPAGLVQAIPSHNEALIEILQGKPDKIFLTGSADEARHVLSLTAERLIPVHIETSPLQTLIALADVHLDHTSSAILTFLARARDVAAVKDSFYFHESVAIPLLETLRTKNASASEDESTKVRIRGLIDAMEPKKFRSISDLVFQVNSTPGAPAVCVFSKNSRLAHEVAKQLSSTLAIINDYPYSRSLPEIPYGGSVSPQPGRLGSEMGLLEFVQVQSVLMPRSRLFHFKSPWWLPYSTYQFETFRTYLDLYRRHWTDKIKAVPLFLWNLIQMFKNEKRL